MTSRAKSTPITVLLDVDASQAIWRFPADLESVIAERFKGVNVIRPKNAREMKAALPRADVLYSWWLAPDMLGHARRLRWIHTPAAGVDRLLIPQLLHSDIFVTNSRGIAADAMADHVFAMILALVRRLPESVRFQSQQRWGRETLWATEPPPSSLAGKTLGIVGLGGVGAALTKRARAFGMKVIGSRSRPGKAPKGVDKLYGPDGHLELIAASDVIAVTAPLTQATRGLIGLREIAKMKPTAYLVNVGRGALVDETALLRALRERKIAGAALDVFQREPLPPSSVLWKLPNLLITPHYAGTYPEHMARATELFLENLGHFVKGRIKKMKNVVDKKRGY